MDTRTITADVPPEGTLAFNGQILVRFAADGVFHVFNGNWSGTYHAEGFITHRFGSSPSEPFREVVEMTDKERDRWYLTGPITVPLTNEEMEGDAWVAF